MQDIKMPGKESKAPILNIEQVTAVVRHDLLPVHPLQYLLCQTLKAGHFMGENRQDKIFSLLRIDHLKS